MRVTSPRQLKNDYGDKVNFHSVQRFNQFRKVPNITADSVKAVDNNYLIRDHPYDADLIDGYVDLMVEVCCAGREAVRINQEDIAAAVVQSRFLLLGLDSLELLHPVLNHSLGHGVNLLFLFDVGGDWWWVAFHVYPGADLPNPFLLLRGVLAVTRPPSPVLFPPDIMNYTICSHMLVDYIYGHI